MVKVFPEEFRRLLGDHANHLIFLRALENLEIDYLTRFSKFPYSHQTILEEIEKLHWDENKTMVFYSPYSFSEADISGGFPLTLVKEIGAETMAKIKRVIDLRAFL
jgi:hypothetical protein